MLQDSQVSALGLAPVSRMLSALPGAKVTGDTKASWSVSPLPKALGGHSCHVAAACAYVSRFAAIEVERRHQTAGLSRVWATGELFENRSGLHILPVGGPAGSTAGLAFQAKLQAFADTDDAVFLCTSEDIAQVSFEARSHRCVVLCLDDFRGWLDSPTSERVIVALERPEFVRLLCVLFHGLLAKQTLHTGVLSWRIRKPDRSALGELVQGQYLQISHLELPPSGQQLLAFPSSDSAAAFGEALLRRVPDAAVCIDMGDVEYDGVSAAGPVIRRLRALLEVTSDGSICATEPALARLSLPVYGLILEGLANDVRAYDITPGHHPYLLRVSTRRFSVPAYRIAKILTISRVPFGALAGVLFAWGAFLPGLIAYIVGLATDVLDGLIARSWNSVSGWGKRHDGTFDAIFNTLSVMGYLIGALFIWRTPIFALYLVVGTLVLVVGTYPWIPPGSRAAKCRSGVVRCVIVACVLAKLPSASATTILVGLVPSLAIAAVYELSVMAKSEHYGISQGWFGPPPTARERPDQKLLRAVLGRVGLTRLANRAAPACGRPSNHK